MANIFVFATASALASLAGAEMQLMQMSAFGLNGSDVARGLHEDSTACSIPTTPDWFSTLSGCNDQADFIQLRTGNCKSTEWRATIPACVDGSVGAFIVSSRPDESSARHKSDRMDILVDGSIVATVFNDIWQTVSVPWNTSNVELRVRSTSYNSIYHYHMRVYQVVFEASTQAPTPAPTPAINTASATGDPHLRNVLGQRFDVMKPGQHVLINIPRGEHPEKALLLVQADARRLGGGCADMYFQELNITGSWATARRTGGYRYTASQHVIESQAWMALGTVEVKVVRGRTQANFPYLNFYVKNLGRAGLPVGGLLGEDDHSDAGAIPEACFRRMSLGLKSTAIAM